ncbi:unnamed protein product [Anisakis simplex]|uniref:Uncharacterized protein n=1 Tax=Anisakis simplex TaxID=6269 RepID=A0A0M3IZX5_ANISI|nr:unnamed protein product [Anisakis simplex]
MGQWFSGQHHIDSPDIDAHQQSDCDQSNDQANQTPDQSSSPYRVLFTDPRSPTSGIQRTPIFVKSTPKHTQDSEFETPRTTAPSTISDSEFKTPRSTVPSSVDDSEFKTPRTQKCK